MLVGIIFFGVRTTVQSNVVIGPSMEPDLHDGQRLLVNRAVYWFSDPERGDVITFHAPDGHQEDYIKRIIGLPGDTIEIKAGAVFVNGSQLDEPYIADAPGYVVGELEVPPDNYFVLGDNRRNSNDSHSGWTVPRTNIIGKAWLSIWPPADWGVVLNYPLEEQLSGFMNNVEAPLLANR